jgi:hypothetical protein
MFNIKDELHDERHDGEFVTFDGAVAELKTPRSTSLGPATQPCAVHNLEDLRSKICSRGVRAFGAAQGAKPDLRARGRPRWSAVAHRSCWRGCY